MRTGKILIPFGFIALLLAAAVWAGHSSLVQDFLIRQIARQRLDRTRAELLGRDRISVVLCGTGVPDPDLGRASACTAVFAGGQFFLVDIGPSSARKAGAFALPLAALSGVLLTHFHSDHIGDLGEINTQSWLAGRSHSLAVYGPQGVQSVVEGFLLAYGLDRGYRAAVTPMLSAQAWPMEGHTVIIPESNQYTGSVTVLTRDGLRITAFAVDHSPAVPAFGYRFDYRGRAVVISGDTAKSSNLIRAAAGADLLIHEAEAKHIIRIVQKVAGEQHDLLMEQTLGGIQRYHSTPVEAAEVANQAAAKLLVLSHLAPSELNLAGRWAFMRGVSAVRPHGVRLGEDGMLITLPIGSDEIRVSRLH
jgi:ribonuclease Z